MGYSRVDCRAGVFALLALFLVPTLWGTLLCPLPCYGTDNQRYENHLYADCPGVGHVARGLRTSTSSSTVGLVLVVVLAVLVAAVGLRSFKHTRRVAGSTDRPTDRPTDRVFFDDVSFD